MCVSNNGRKKETELEEEAMSEVPIADTALKSGAIANDVRRLF